MQGNGFTGSASSEIHPVLFSLLIRIFLDRFFHETVPRVATRTFSQPFGALITTALTKKSGFDFTHRVKVKLANELIRGEKPMKEKKKSDEASYNPCTDRKIMILSILKFDRIMIAGKMRTTKLCKENFQAAEAN